MTNVYINIIICSWTESKQTNKIVVEVLIFFRIPNRERKSNFKLRFVLCRQNKLPLGLRAERRVINLIHRNLYWTMKLMANGHSWWQVGTNWCCHRETHKLKIIFKNCNVKMRTLENWIHRHFRLWWNRDDEFYETFFSLVLIAANFFNYSSMSTSGGKLYFALSRSLRQDNKSLNSCRQSRCWRQR